MSRIARLRPALAGRALIVTMAALAASAIAAQTAAADPTPFATATGNCSSSQVTFPVQSSAHPATEFSLTSNDATGSVESDDFYPGDEVWGEGEGVNAGTAPTVGVNCSGGSYTISLYDMPTAPVTFTGAAASPSSLSYPTFTTLGAGQYVLNVTLSQGAINIFSASSNQNTTIASSGQYPLGSLPAGINNIQVRGLSGPTALYTLSVAEVPVQISNLSFNGAQYASTGSILTGSFTVSGDTTINAYVRSAAGPVVRHIGSFPVTEGGSSVTWDARGDGGATLADGVYYLHLDSTDPNGNVTSAEIPVTLDSTPPSVATTSPATITPSQSVSFAVADAESGVKSVSLLVDGQDVEDFGTYGQPITPTFSYDNNGFGWTLGEHTWEIQATDNAGNSADVSGVFAVVNPPPPPKPPAITGAAATRAFGKWLRARYGSRLSTWWACPQAQIITKTAYCIAEFHAAPHWYQVDATAKYSGNTLQITQTPATHWRRAWSKYSAKVIRGNGAPGRAQVNSPALTGRSWPASPTTTTSGTSDCSRRTTSTAMAAASATCSTSTAVRAGR